MADVKARVQAAIAKQEAANREGAPFRVPVYNAFAHSPARIVAGTPARVSVRHWPLSLRQCSHLKVPSNVCISCRQLTVAVHHTFACLSEPHSGSRPAGTCVCRLITSSMAASMLLAEVQVLCGHLIEKLCSLVLRCPADGRGSAAVPAAAGCTVRAPGAR